MPDDYIGRQLGNYRLISLLGQGGSADVYLGEHVHLDTQAAIKILHTQFSSGDIEHFRSEARIIAHLEHPNIVRTLDFGVEGKIPFLAISYAPNGTLRQRHPRRTQVPLETVVVYVQQIASALQYAHSQRLIHRDVKPENMLVGRNNEILLSDFGIALITQSSRYQSTKDIVGTVSYMAPEQFQGKPQPASDQYALGVVVYEWLTGTRPFEGTLIEVAVQHATTPPPPLHLKLPGISLEIEEVVHMALAKDPERRFTTIQTFATALEQASGSQHFVPSNQQPQFPLTSMHVDRETQSTVLATPYPQPKQMTLSVRVEYIHTRRGISRRTVLLAISGLAVAGGGFTWFALAQRPGSTTNSNATATPVTRKATSTIPVSTPTKPLVQPTVTSPPVGNLFQTYRGHTDYIYGITWAAQDGQRIASAGNDTTVQVWNPATDGRYFIYKHSKAVNDVKSSVDKAAIASAGEDAIVQVRDAVSGILILTYPNHSGAVNTVEWSRVDSRVVSASSDGTAHIWDARSGKTIVVYRGHTAGVWAAGWSPDGQRAVSVSTDGTAKVWDASSGTTLVTYQGHSATVRSVSWSPDGQRIATASDDHTVHIWNAFTGARILIYQGHSDLMRTVAWSPDGRRIVSGAKDATAQIWDPTTGNRLFVYYGHSETVFDAQWSPDGTRIASCSTDTTVQIWQAV